MVRKPKPRRVQLDGRNMILLRERDYQSMRRTLAEKAGWPALPPLPPARKDGAREAVPFILASIARSIIRGRRDAGLSREDLAKLARVATIVHAESGKHLVSTSAIDKIDAALRRAAKPAKKPTRRGAGQTKAVAPSSPTVREGHKQPDHQGRPQAARPSGPAPRPPASTVAPGARASSPQRGAGV